MKICSAILLVSLLHITAYAQLAGSRGGSEQDHYKLISHRSYDQTIQQYIEVEGSVLLRVQPDQIRIVLAVYQSGNTSSECEQKLFAKLNELKQGLKQSGIAEENIVDDFIAVLPKYQLDMEQGNGRSAAIETLVGYQMQSNLHIKVADDARAMQAIRIAFGFDVSDIIAFDYGSSKLDEVKQQALKQAVAVAKEKADLLLLPAFEKMPRVVNVKSATQVIMPESLYKTVENSSSEIYVNNSSRNNNSRDIIRAARPKNTFYQGLVNGRIDQQPSALPMRSEISVIATVQYYYDSPVAGEYRNFENPASESGE